MYQVWKYKLDHAAFWLITALFYAFTRKEVINTSGWGPFLLDVLTRNLLIAGACYFNIYFLFERLARKGRYVLYALFICVLLAFYTLAQNGADYWLNNYNSNEQERGFLYHSYYHFSIGLFYLAFTLALELSKRWYQQQLVLHKVQSENLQTELQYLKAQLNPHFLFNCINSIYFQIDPSNKEARESLHKFSELLRYQLYECNEDKIPIEKETDYIANYVDLQRLRKNTNNTILFRREENIQNFRIAPLLLLPFVENAFKHLPPEAGNIIDLHMKRENGSFIFSIKNTAGDQEDSATSGIGLKNVKRRLDLLYPGKYVLDIKKSKMEYSVRLELII